MSDNGAGITPATVAGLCDFTMLVSDKARYRGPTRGAQGNAFKTLLGIPYALGVAEPVVIESAGVRHELRVTVDRVGDVVVTHETTASDRTVGTSVTVPLPAAPRKSTPGGGRTTRRLSIRTPPSACGLSRLTPATAPPTKIAFFTNPQVRHGRSGCRHSRRRRTGTTGPRSRRWCTAISATGDDKPLGRFISEFDGLSGSAKQRAIRAAVPGVTHLSGLDGRDDLIAKLHDAMLDHAKPTRPSGSARSGRTTSGACSTEYGVRDLWYKSAEIVDDDGIPWVIEVAVADTAKPGGVWFGCNHAPSFDDPLGRTELEEGDVWAEGVRSFLEEADIKPAQPPRRRRPRHLRRRRVHGQGQGHARRPGQLSQTRPRRRCTSPPGRCGRRPSSAARTPVRPSRPSSGGARQPPARSGRTSGP